MKINPLITVIVPIYNGEKYVRACLDNLMFQTYKHLEVIVIDDGSTDKTSEIIRNYPVKIITHTKNKGLSAARNSGIDAALGDYIHFFDVDDNINDVFYEEMLKSIVETQADIACAGMVQDHNNYKTQRFKKQQVYVSTKDRLTVTYVGKWGYVWRYLFRLNFLKEHNLRFEEGRFIEDLLFSLSAVYLSKKLVTVPKAESLYNLSENSILTNKEKAHRDKRRADKKYAKAQVLSFAKEHNLKIPGVNSGLVSYIIRKIYRNIFS